MRNINLSITSVLFILICQNSTGQVLGGQGTRYNEKNFDQGFVYDFNVDSMNNISGSIIQENKSVDQEWCAYLKVTALRKDNSTIAIFATAPHKVEAKGKDINGKVFSQKVNWKLKEQCYDLKIEAITSCTPISGQ